MKRLVLFMALAAICGCTDSMLVDIHNGNFCNSTNVEAYADKHGITYEQSLEELSRQSGEVLENEAAQTKADSSVLNTAL